MPNTREKLVELLKPYVSGLACEQESGSCELTDCRSCNALYAASKLIAHGVTVQEWISVKDRLPEIDQPCLCYKKRKGHSCYQLGTYLGASFSENCAAFKSMSHYGCIGATHWMPLPTPPKGE